MQITDQQVDKFIQIYQKNFGVVLERESAREKGRKLVELMKLVLKENAKHTKEVLCLKSEK